MHPCYFYEICNDAKFIPLQKIEWESLSFDLLPHPDMFADASLARSQGGSTHRDDDGAKRVFFGGERFLEGISGEAHVMEILHIKRILDDFFALFWNMGNDQKPCLVLSGFQSRD